MVGDLAEILAETFNDAYSTRATTGQKAAVVAMQTLFIIIPSALALYVSYLYASTLHNALTNGPRKHSKTRRHIVLVVVWLSLIHI